MDIASHPSPTVFIVDDDASVRRALRRLLIAANYRVVTCASAEEFLSLKDGIPTRSCLIVDVQMPGMTGPALQDALRRAHRDTPFVLISGHADPGTAAHARAAGAIAFLSKPFDDTRLFEVLDQAFATGHMQPEVPGQVDSAVGKA